MVSGAPSIHWRHAWDDDYTADEQWPYQVTFHNTNIYGYANIINGVDETVMKDVDIVTKGKTVFINDLPSASVIRVYNLLGRCISEDKTSETFYQKDMTEGIYIISVQTKQGTINRKIMIR